MANSNKKVMIAMSGGVDSSVAAYLLKMQGYQVSGVTMCLGIKSALGNEPKCCGEESVNDAKSVCIKLDIPHHTFDYSNEMRSMVINKFIDIYADGKTPNPCIDCNRYIKFGLLLDKSVNLGFDYLATGHYAAVEKICDSYFLKKPADKTKDQTYFLYSIRKKNLPKIIFPLADYSKLRVREMAKELGLPVAQKKESQEVCFIDKKQYGEFFKQNVNPQDMKPGNILDINGKIIGKHKGIVFYTIGQRKGFGISAKNPLYVVKINKEKSEITVGERIYLKNKKLIANELNLFCEKLPERAKAKIRYNHKEADCILLETKSGLMVTFDAEQEAMAPGQSVVFYDGEIILGGGVIKEVLYD